MRRRGKGSVDNVVMQGGGNIHPGAYADGSVGTLTVGNLTVNGGDMRFDLVSTAPTTRSS